MAKSRRRQPKRAAGSGRTTTRTLAVRTVLALLLLTAGVALVLLLAQRSRREVAPSQRPRAEDVVKQVAARHGCPAERISFASARDGAGVFWTATVHAPRGFPADRFSLDLQAAAHNLGGRLEPKPLLERGGYGMARLEGEVGGERWRVVVLGEAPPPTPVAVPTTRQVPPTSARLAIVLDDAGESLEIVQEVAKLPASVAVAVLPNATHSAEVARALSSLGREVLLHMPMEPVANHGTGPGPGAVEVGLTEDAVRERLDSALATVAVAKGVNNHMGSRATADAATMRAVMIELHRRGLYFLDSRTTADTVAESEARANGVPALHRDIFLDVVGEPDAVQQALTQAMARAREKGSALAIGHVHPVTLAVLARELPNLPPDVTLVRPSQLLGHQD
ncbi:MAG: divergent polysaccharide deacetylase family protein [Thermoanaerobaculales bacterium]